eukprot:TRINITY_DN2624_c0_g1_i2.p1 TRINITY_DN2624_c0_g1~~TRINITY_DN2624_c0_g1_i2.p1  ORF type:complete len:622 (+),score=124.57 TRINITY_DN2624_c0_g1_i2:353-2218(+)
MELLVLGYVILMASITSTLTTSLNGNGASSPSDILNKLINTYQGITNDHISYTSSNSANGITLTRNNKVDFGITFYSASSGVSSFPIFAEPFGFCYNIPNVSAPLNLSYPLLSAIFQGKVKSWDDPLLVAINPGLSKLSRSYPINVMLRGGSSGTLYIFNNFMATLDPFFAPYAGLSTPPTVFKNITLTTGDNFGLFAPVYMTPYSITFASLALYQSLGINANVKIANMIVNDHYLDPSSQRVVESIKDSVYDAGSGSVKVLNTSVGWPITGYTFVILNANETFSNCTNRRETLKFFNWVISSNGAHELVTRGSYVVLQGGMLDQVQSYLNSLKCLGEDSLGITIEDPSSWESSKNVILIVSVIVYSGQFFIGLAVFYVEVTNTGKIYYLILTLGNILSLITIILFSIPSTSSLCILREWFLFTSETIFLGSVFCRNLQLKLIQNLVDDGKFNSRIRNNQIFAFGMTIVLLLQFLILALWTGLDPMVVTVTLVDPWQRIAVKNCSCSNVFIWFGIELAFSLLLLCFGVFVVYSTWNIRKKVDDSRMIATSVYLTILIVIITYVILGGISDDLSALYWATGYTMGISITFSFCVFLPKLVRFYKKYFLKVPSTGSNITTTND